MIAQVVTFLTKTPWIATHHLIIYCILPLLVSSFITLICNETPTKGKYVLFSFLSLVSLLAYNNMAFFILVLLLEIAFSIVYLLLKGPSLIWPYICKVAILLSLQMLLCAWFLIPYVQANMIFASKIVTTKAFGGNSFNNVIATPNSILNIFMLNVNAFNSKENIIAMIYPLVFIFLLLTKKSSYSKTLITFIFLYLLLIFLTVRVSYPFLLANTYLYHLPLFQFFRSPDKIFMALPYVFFTIIAYLVIECQLDKKWKYLLIGIMLCVPYPYLLGEVRSALTATNDQGYSFSFSIPKEYIEQQKIINNDNRTVSIISLPYSVMNSLNWSNYPLWHYVGHDILHLLYNKFYISANTYDHPNYETELSFKDYNESSNNSDVLLSNVQKFSGAYVFFHKDIDSSWVQKSSHIYNSLKELSEKKILTSIASNNYFDLYRVQDEWVQPLISIQNGNTRFLRVNSAHYDVDITIKDKQQITFNQAYNPEWQIYLRQQNTILNCSKKYVYTYASSTECETSGNSFQINELLYLFKSPLPIEHIMVNQYANAWIIDTERIKHTLPQTQYRVNADGSITLHASLFFRPQSYLYIGGFTILLVGVGVAMYSLVFLLKKYV